MNFASRPALVLFGCAALAATQLYACGIDLDVAAADDAGSSSSGTSGRTSSGSPSSSSSSSGSGSGSTSGSSSGRLDGGGDDAAADASDGNDASSCQSFVLAAADVKCDPLGGGDRVDFPVQGQPGGYCTRTGGAPSTGDTLTTDGPSQATGVWVQLASTQATDAFEIEAVLDIKGDATIGAGFAVALVQAKLDAAVGAIPSVGDNATQLGIGNLVEFVGTAAAVQTYTNLVLQSVTVPDSVPKVEVGTTAPFGRYHLQVKHEAGADTLKMFVKVDGDAGAEVSLSSAPYTMTGPIEFVGVTASTGEATQSEQRLVSLSWTCPPSP